MLNQNRQYLQTVQTDKARGQNAYPLKRAAILQSLLKDYPEIYRVCLKRYKTIKKGNGPAVKIRQTNILPQEIPLLPYSGGTPSTMELYCDRHIPAVYARQLKLTLHRFLNDSEEESPISFVFWRSSINGKVKPLAQEKTQNVQNIYSKSQMNEVCLFQRHCF